MHGIAWIALALAVLSGAWMLIDGSRALLVGDYFTPRSGRHAGELGAWSHLVLKAGIAPRSLGMKLVFIIYGGAWLGAAASFALGLPTSYTLMLVFAAGALWYLPIGTVLAGVQIALLLAWRFV
jgi:hypothetical protein